MNWAPTFAFIDPNGPDVHWSTIEALAKFKKAGRTKTEIWLLLAGRHVHQDPATDGTVREVDAAKLDHMYGTEQWRRIYEARVRGDLQPGDARDEYVNLMRWRLENVLGYQWTHPLEIFNERGHSIYHMVFATDHEVGNRIMTDLYSAAADEFPACARRLDIPPGAVGRAGCRRADSVRRGFRSGRRGTTRAAGVSLHPLRAMVAVRAADR